jgi:hypothetical protein
MVHPTQNLNRKQKLIWHLKILAGAVFLTLTVLKYNQQ